MRTVDGKQGETADASPLRWRQGRNAFLSIVNPRS